MFDTSKNVVISYDNGRVLTADELKERCLESAALWVLKRRAKLPYLSPQRLPVVARAS